MKRIEVENGFKDPIVHYLTSDDRIFAKLKQNYQFTEVTINHMVIKYNNKRYVYNSLIHNLKVLEFIPLRLKVSDVISKTYVFDLPPGDFII